MRRSSQSDDAALRWAAAKSIHEQNLHALEAALYTGPRSAIEVARNGVAAANEALCDRLTELMWHRLIDSDFDPKERWK